MKIGVVGSMQNITKMLELRDELIKLGHDAFTTRLADDFRGVTDEDEIERIKLRQKEECDTLREFWDLMEGGDAILVANITHKGIDNYIGGNTFLEMGFAHILHQKIFLLHPVPDIPLIATEIASMNPIVIDGDLTKIR